MGCRYAGHADPRLPDAGKPQQAFCLGAAVPMVLTYAALWQIVNLWPGLLCRTMQQSEEMAISITANISILQILIVSISSVFGDTRRLWVHV